MALEGISAALGGSQLLMKVLLYGAVAAGGFTAAETYEHTAPWGLEAQRDRSRASIPGLQVAATRAGQASQAVLDRDAFGKWDAALRTCEASRVGATTVAAQAMDTQAKITDLSRTAAYRLGQASCGVPNAGNTNLPTGPVSPGSSGTGGVPVGDTDLASVLLGAAYSPRPR